MHGANPKCSRFHRGVRGRSKLLKSRPSALGALLFPSERCVVLGRFAEVSLFPVHEQSVITMAVAPRAGGAD